MSVKSGRYDSDFITPVGAEQVQPNGIDLRAERVYRFVGTGDLTKDGMDKPSRKELPLQRNTSKWLLAQGAYMVQYRERIKIPEDCVGIVRPRSSLMRSGAMLHTALWDAGYEGRGEGLLVVFQEMYLQEGTRIGQMVFKEADEPDETYDGQYQGENL